MEQLDQVPEEKQKFFEPDSRGEVVEPTTDIDKAKLILSVKQITSADIAEDSGLNYSMVSSLRNHADKFENARLNQIKAIAKVYDLYSKQLDFTQPEKIVAKHYYVMAD